MPEARLSGFAALRLLLAALGLTLGWCALTLVLGADAALADDNPASHFAPPPATVATDPTGEAVRASTGAVANSAMPALEAVAATLTTATLPPAPMTEPAAEEVEPLVQAPADPVVPVVQAAAEPVAAPVVQAIVQPLTPVLHPITDPLTSVAPQALTPTSETAVAPLSGAQTSHHEPAASPARAAVVLSTSSIAADPAAALHSGGAPPWGPADSSPVSFTPVAALEASGTTFIAPTATTDDRRSAASAGALSIPLASGDTLPAGPAFDPGSTPD